LTRRPYTHVLHNPRPEIARDLEIIVLKRLEKKPERRYGSASILADDCGRYRDGEPIRAERIG
jgi:hypothetical protein